MKESLSIQLISRLNFMVKLKTLKIFLLRKGISDIKI